MEYYTASRDALSERVLRPCALLQNRGAWYTVGHDERLFKVERIRRMEITDERFELPPGFDLERYRRGLVTEDRRPFDVVVRSGDHTRTFPAWSRPQTKSWMRTAAGATELIEPEDLRRELVAETRELLARYRTA
jgi:predicted DNA-binding transcriptional regulator YafY